MTEGEDPYRDLRRLERKATELERQIHAIDAENLRWEEKRDVLNLTVKRHRETAERHRLSRNGHNKEVKASTAVLDALKRTLIEKRRAVTQEQRKLAALLETTSTSESLLRDRKRDLEWKMQTSTLSPEEEADLIHTLRSVERALLVHCEASSVKARIRACHSEIDAVTLRVEDEHRRRARSVASSQEDHAKMREALSALRNARERADDAHRRYVDGRQASAAVRRELTALLTRIMSVTRGLEERRREASLLRAQENTAARTDAALDRLKKKRRISLADFKALRKQGFIQEYE